MGNRLVKGRVQRFNPTEDVWELFDIEEDRVVARRRGGPWNCVRHEGKAQRRSARRPVVEGVAA